MNKTELLQIAKLGTLTPKQIKKKNPKLYSKIEDKASGELKAKVASKLKNAPNEIRERFAKLDFSASNLKKNDIKDLLEKEISKSNIESERKTELMSSMSQVRSLGRLENMILPDLPIFLNPLFEKDVKRSKLLLLNQTAGINDSKIDAIFNKDVDVNNLSGARLEMLVKDKTLTRTEADNLGLVSNLHTLLDENIDLVKVVKRRSKPTGLSDLVTVTEANWKKWIQEAKVEFPDDLDADGYALFLSKKVQNLNPELSLQQKLVKVKESEIKNSSEVLDVLFENNNQLFGPGGFEKLDTKGISASELNKIKSNYRKLESIIRSYPGMDFETVLGTKKFSTSDRDVIVNNRLNDFKKFVDQNSDVHFLSLDYKHDSKDLQKLKFQGISKANSALILRNVKAQQRVHSFTQDVDDTNILMKAGYHSSFHVTSSTLEEFIQNSGLELEVAERYFENAHTSFVRTTGFMGSILDVVTGSFDWTAVGNTGPTVKDYLRDIPGYQELFGELAFCECEHCQSIYSPAAYFVDLMQFVEQYALNKYFINSFVGHVLNLKVRRPDLWTLELSCENTSELIPYLDIINPILENYIAKHLGFSGALEDRSDVEDFIYRAIAIDRSGAWKNFVNSFEEPFHLPLCSVGIYLSHFETSREDIARLLGKEQLDISTAAFELSEKELDLITKEDKTQAFIKRVYGHNFSSVGSKIAPFDAQILLKPMYVNRKELGAIVAAQYVTNYGNDNIVIQSEKINANSVQNDIERIRNLTYASLDRMHRFVRFWKKTSLSIEELDLFIVYAKESNLAPDLSKEIIASLGLWINLKDTLQLDTDEMFGVFQLIPDVTLIEDDKSLLDRLFNHEDIVTTEGYYPKDAIKMIHPSLVIDSSTSNAEFGVSRLTAGLNRSEDEVLILLKELADPLDLNLEAPAEVDRGFFITLDNLSLLYRHSKLADQLSISVSDLFRLLDTSSEFPNGYIENIAQITKLVELHSWWQDSGYSIDDLHYILDSDEVVNVEDYNSAEVITEEIFEKVSEGNQLLFADTVFSYLEGISEEQSKNIIKNNEDSIILAPDGTNYWLSSDFDMSDSLTLPGDISVNESNIKDVLISYHALYLVPFHLSSHFKMSEDIIILLLKELGYNLDDELYTTDLQLGSVSSVEWTALTKKLLIIDLLFKKDKFVDEVMDYVINNQSKFKINSFSTITLPTIHFIHQFSLLVSIDELGDSNVSHLSDLFGSYTMTNQFKNADQEALAEFLEIESELVESLHPIADQHKFAIPALRKYKEIAELCSYIGVSGSTLLRTLSKKYRFLNDVKLQILGAFQSKYKNEEERLEKLEKYQDAIRGKKRAALTTFLIHSGFPHFKDSNDLYHYFLIDTELEGCARTSRLVAATMSLQLYVHRILLNLEQDDKDPGDANRIYVHPSSIPADEWSWRKNYRVWEANRKVFLYPENYIEPDLRDNKTPLFEELESELLQQEINEDNVLEAYGRYMRGFDELSHLKIAGSYHEKDTETESDALHLFGVSSAEPPMFYYRRVENLFYSEKRDDRGISWDPWKKINVQIPVRKVAPITYNGRLHVFWTKVTSLANTTFDNNKSMFVGYSHKISIEFTTLKLDGTWTTPQKLNLKDCFPFEGNGVIKDPLADRHEIDDFTGSLHEALRSFPFFNWGAVTAAIEKLKTPRYALTPHYEPVDEYTLDGFLWDRVYPHKDSTGRLVLTGSGFQMRAAVDFYNLDIQNLGTAVSEFTNDPVTENITIVKEKAGKIILKDGNRLYRAVSPSTQKFDNFAFSSLLVNAKKSDSTLNSLWADSTLDSSYDNIKHEIIATLRSGSEVQIVNGAYSDAIIDSSGDLLLLQGSPIEGDGFVMRRIGTTISETLTRTLFTSGVDTALSIETQKVLKEQTVPFSLYDQVDNKVVSDKIDWTGAYGTYYREIFFHIPFLLANHLNSQGKYAEAQKWYHYIFNPGADEVLVFPSGATLAEKKKIELDRNWQYLEFRNIDFQTLRDQLNNKEAIEAYKKDPFNPHAIARLRLSAYQKSIVMKYIDNLLDWGDQLFTLDTMESINEATLLYIMAKEIMGTRPIEIGDCGEGTVSPKNYETIQPLLAKGSEFLAELESYSIVKTPGRRTRFDRRKIRSRRNIALAGRRAMVRMGKSRRNAIGTMTNSYSIPENRELRNLRGKQFPNISVKPVNDNITGAYSKGVSRSMDWKKDSIYAKNKYRIPSFGWSLVRHVSPVFCVPGNKDLLDYYDRVDDRLFKIRNCMNILGQRRELSLFAPEIDPMFLVRARAAGLSMDDILNSISGNLPPYRFSYILDRAKSFVSTVQGFGSSLLGAMERRDSEEISLLRMTHQQNILEMTTKSKELEIKTAEEGINVLTDRLESLDYRIGYYEGLINERTNAWEVAQQTGKHGAAIIRGSEALISFAAGLLHLIPDVGSPFAMKYGGSQLGPNLSAFAFAMNGLADLGDNLASSAGLEAGFDRRSENWKHQKTILENEKSQIEKNLVAAEIRREILVESLSTHQKQIEHNQEMMDFFGEKFSNLGLYTWMSSTMQQLYKEAYNNALAIAKLAEQAYRYERDDDTFFIEDSYFEASRGGLLAGNKLLLALQTMERRYIETNYRKHEIDQAFSLTQIDPAALLNLKNNGMCEFTIPEIYYDLFYPGQYRRKIKSVRVTIPSVTGPYTNVSANLSLISSQIRMDAKLGNAELIDVPNSRTTTIATSTAQNDAGVFELNFRDERYMPFEGAGAISSWKLSLPKSFRQFDYNTINDVIITVSYTSEYDELFRDKVEEQNHTIEGTLLNILKNNSLSRTLSLRQEFSVDFHRLVEQPIDSSITVKIQNKHFPLFLKGKEFEVNTAKLILVTHSDQTVNGVNIAINDISQTGFAVDVSLGNFYTKDLGNLFSGGIVGEHTMKIVAAGDLAAVAPEIGPVPAFDNEKILDIILHIEYNLSV